MARNVYGLDLGTYDIKIFDKKKDRIWHAKNVIAMKDKKYIITLLNCYVDNLSNDLKARWNNWNKNFNEKEIHEVLGGLLARQISITIELARISILSEFLKVMAAKNPLLDNSAATKYSPEIPDNCFDSFLFVIIYLLTFRGFAKWRKIEAESFDLDDR
mgnify:CR=1 FL=1